MHTKDKLEQARTANNKSKITAHEKTLKQYRKQLKNPSLYEALCDWKAAQEGTSNLARMTPRIEIDKKGIALSDIKHLQERHSPVLGLCTVVSVKSSTETFMICGSQKQVIQSLNDFSQNSGQEPDFITPWENLAKDKDAARKIYIQSLKDIARTPPAASHSNTTAPRTFTKQVQDLFAKFGSKKEKKPPQKKKPSAPPKAQK